MQKRNQLRAAQRRGEVVALVEKTGGREEREEREERETRET